MQVYVSWSSVKHAMWKGRPLTGWLADDWNKSCMGRLPSRKKSLVYRPSSFRILFLNWSVLWRIGARFLRYRAKVEPRVIFSLSLFDRNNPPEMAVWLEICVCDTSKSNQDYVCGKERGTEARLGSANNCVRADMTFIHMWLGKYAATPGQGSVSPVAAQESAYRGAWTRDNKAGRNNGDVRQKGW